MCMGREMNVAFFSKDVEGCGGPESRKMPCCEDINELIEIEDNHKQANLSIDFSDDFVTISNPYSIDLSVVRKSTEQLTNHWSIPDPPDRYHAPIFILHSNLTYYG